MARGVGGVGEAVLALVSLAVGAHRCPLPLSLSTPNKCLLLTRGWCALRPVPNTQLHGEMALVCNCANAIAAPGGVALVSRDEHGKLGDPEILGMWEPGRPSVAITPFKKQVVIKAFQEPQIRGRHRFLCISDLHLEKDVWKGSAAEAKILPSHFTTLFGSPVCGRDSKGSNGSKGKKFCWHMLKGGLITIIRSKPQSREATVYPRPPGSFFSVTGTGDPWGWDTGGDETNEYDRSVVYRDETNAESAGHRQMGNNGDKRWDLGTTTTTTTTTIKPTTTASKEPTTTAPVEVEKDEVVDPNESLPDLDDILKDDRFWIAINGFPSFHNVPKDSSD